MGLNISPVLANIFLNNLETKFLDECPENIKPKFYKRFLDDTFLLFDTAEQLKQFFQYVIVIHRNIKFTYEVEVNNTLSFLDITVRRINNTFETSIFRKKTFTGLSTNFFSSIYDKYKTTAVITLLHRASRVC